MVKKTALYNKHKALNAKILPFAGYEMPIRYTGDVQEHKTVREGAGIFDVSHMGEFMIKGPKALDLIQFITTNDASKLTNGKAQYSCFPNGKGGIVDDCIVYKFEDQVYMIVVNASNIEKDWNWVVEQNKQFGAEIENISEKTSLIAVSGPKAREIVQKFTNLDLSTLSYYSFSRCKVQYGNHLIEKAIIATTGYTGEWTFEIFIPNDHAEGLWDALTHAGAAPCGLGARDTLRLEMGYMLYGNDIDDTTSPLEAGLGWITKLNKGKFIDSELYAKQKVEGVKRRLVAFEMVEKGGIARHDCQISKNHVVVGKVTSGSQSPMLNKGIGMGYVPVEYSAEGTELEIIIRDKPFKAKVVTPPFVKNTSLSKK